MAQLYGGKIHRNAQTGVALGMPLPQLAAGLIKHPFADLDDAAVLLRQRDEQIRWDQLALGVFPADQCLDAGDAVADLALANFIEMRDLVGQPAFLLRKKIEARFSERHPEKWTPLYTMVTFSETPYSVALREGKRQDRIMEQVMAMPEIESKWDSDEVESLMLELLG